MKNYDNGKDNDEIYSICYFKNKIKNVESKKKSLLFLYTKILTLTNSELEVLYLLCYKHTPEAISKKRNVSQSTIRNIISSILAKLEYKNYKELLTGIDNLALLDLIKNMFSDDYFNL